MVQKFLPMCYNMLLLLNTSLVFFFYLGEGSSVKGHQDRRGLEHLHFEGRLGVQDWLEKGDFGYKN